jgi:hypothetical protein
MAITGAVVFSLVNWVYSEHIATLSDQVREANLRAKPDRHLSSDEKKRLEYALKHALPPLQNQQIETQAVVTPEATQYLNECTDVFQAAGLRVIPLGITTFTTTRPEETNGLFVSVKDENNAPELALTLLEAIRKAGFSISLNTTENVQNDNWIDFVVGYQ